MKIGIVTLHGYFNFGNRLQNFALLKFLEKEGYVVETIKIQRENYNFTVGIKQILTKGTKKMRLREKDIRELKFIRFSEEFLNEYDRLFYLNSDLKSLNNRYDYVIVGSDQVWNPHMNKKSSLFFLDFLPKEKRISYAASFGIDEISPNDRRWYIKMLGGMNNISVRETQGQKIVENLIGKRPKVVLDPSFLLRTNDYQKIMLKPNIDLPKRYILTYFLGELDLKLRNYIEELCVKEDMELFDLGERKGDSFSRIGPREFLFLVNNSSLFLTDSFHGMAFSIIFNKPFYVFNRNSDYSMYSRIETIINKLGLESREGECFFTSKNPFKINYAEVNMKLEQERLESSNFLKEVLSYERNSR